MGRWVVAFAFIALTCPATAADFEPSIFGSPYVPAPPTYTRWSGFYAGGQAGFGTTKIDFSDVIALGPSDPFLSPYGPASAWAQFGKTRANAASFGGFVGYNFQWDDVIIGIETNYNRTSLYGSSSASRCYLADYLNTPCFLAIQLGTNPATYYDTTIDTSAHFKITDYVTLRGRAGWAVESFLPYVTAGLAFGRASTWRITTTNGTASPQAPGGGNNPPNPPDPSLPLTVVQFPYTDYSTSTQFLYGYELGTGLDVMLSPSFFLR